MGFYDIVDRAKSLLQKRGRLAVTGLMSEFGLDDAGVERLVEDLTDVQQVATRQGNILSWIGPVEAQTPQSDHQRPPSARESRPPASRHLADKILQSKSALEGERKQVTVLFADVKGSMELAEQMDPETWSQIMQQFFHILTEGVERFEGFVDKFTGDGIMALFGAPIAHEDHARRACYAALHLRDELARYATEVKRKHGVGFSTRMGLNSGEVVVGTIGDDLRMDYTAQGHTVGMAQRMEALAEPNTCFISATTAQLVAGYFAVDDLGDFEVKGVAAPVRVHRVDGIGSSRTRLDVSRARGFSRFVGRGDEMHVLESALARAREGNSQVVGIVGDAGLGKSRLSFEFLERCRSQGLMTYETTGVAHGKATPLVPILKLFRQFFGITDQDSASTARERIAGRLLLLDEKLRDSLPLNFDFLGYPDPDNPPPKMDPESRQRQMFDIVRRVSQARGQKETQVILLEDLHWFDGASAAYLEPLIESAVGSRTLYVLNFRPEFRAPWMGKSYYVQLPLGPLGSDAIRELLDALLGKDSSTRGLAEAIHSRTAGNPFFTEEVVQNLIETGKLQGTKGAYRLVTPVEKLMVPSSVHALLAARIDRLAEREKDVLQTAAVIGREFDEPTLAAVVDQDAPQLREALQKLKDTEFVYEQSLYPVTEYLFKHPLTQEVALASQLQEKRKRLHAVVAQVIEAAHITNLDEQSSLLAHHWEQSGDLSQAVRWHARAAEWAGNRDVAEGLRHWRKVRELGKSSAAKSDREILFRACCQILASGSWRLGMNSTEAQECLAEARSLALELHKPADLASALGGYIGLLTVQGHLPEGLEVLGEVRSMVDGSFTREQLAECEIAGYLLLSAGRIPDAIESFQRLLELTEGNFDIGRTAFNFSLKIFAEMLLGTSLAITGYVKESRRHHERALRQAREQDDNEMKIWIFWNVCRAAYITQDASNSPIRDFRGESAKIMELAGDLTSVYTQLLGTLGLAISCFIGESYAECEELLRGLLIRAEETGTALEVGGLVRSVLADSFLAHGDIENALRYAQEGVEVSRKMDAQDQHAQALAVLADALVRSEADAATVAPIIADARRLVEKSGGRMALPRLREAEARIDGRNDHAALLTGLREAQAMWRATGAQDPVDRLAKELEPAA